MIWAGLIVIGAGLVVLGLDVEGWNTAWFLFAWVGWLLVVDGLIHRLGGLSFLRARRRELGAMLVWSVPFWTVFEIYNLVLDDWTYVFLPRSAFWQAVYAGLAFATVLPACFFHAALLEAAGLRCPPARPAGRRVPRPILVFLVVFGAACMVFPVLWPQVCFWMVWGAGLGIPSVLTYRLGAPSLLRDLEQGGWHRPVRLLGGGLIAGGLWEALNYWARTKWVYTVPGFESLKLFEMPVLGFFGFPVLALAAFESYSLWCHVARGGRHWERADANQPRVPRGHEGLQVLALLAFSVAADSFPLDPAVLSVRPLLSEIDGLDAAELSRLEREGIRTPEQLVRFGNASESAMAHAGMALHKGMGAAHARLVLDATNGFAGLGAADPVELHRELAQRAEAQGVRAPTRAQVAVWIRAVDLDRGRR